MFDFAWSHYALLFIVAVILLGPKEIPVVLRFVGRWVGKIQQHITEWREYIEHIIAEPTSSGTELPESIKDKDSQ